MTTLKDELGKMKKYVRNWNEMLPDDSNWSPGSKADPKCKVCKGTGWLRKDLQYWEKGFGELFLCNCVDRKYHIQLDMERGDKTEVVRERSIREWDK